MDSLKVNEDNNIYDIGIIVLICMLAFGNIGGSLQPIRVMTLCSLPITFSWLLQNNHTKRTQKILFFLFIWYLYIIISFVWTPDTSTGLKEIFYYFIHFSLFIQLLAFADQAKSPKNSISTGWISLLIITIPIALYEIITQNHLPMDTFADAFLNIDGEILPYRRASVTFGNLNAFVVVLVCSLPFLLSKLYNSKGFKKSFLLIVLICLIYIIFVNASRGGIISISAILSVFLFFKLIKTKTINPTKAFKILFSTGIIVYLFFKYFPTIANNSVFAKLSSIFSFGTSKIIEDGPRTQIYETAYKVIYDNYFLGSGVGSEFMVLSINGAEVANSHNLFLELLIQFGIFIFLGFLYLLFRIFYSGRNINIDYHKLVIYCSLCSFIPLVIINSSYLTMPLFWIYLSSLYVYSNKFISK